jgi:16S rRNA (adenine1518-N6/adenine1519-N6)-dimethyltransferase
VAEPAATALPPLRDVIARYELRADKRLGQNFLLDLNLTARIARAAGPLGGVCVLEVGPGPGGLTRALLDAGAREVIAVERDRRCIAALAELAERYAGRLRIVEGDALAIDEASLLGERPARLIANLPYNIATALLLKWLKQPRRFDRLVLMFQKEVADRLAAEPRSKAYGRLSIAVQWRCAVRRLFDIPPRAFTPSPKVTSTLVELVPRAAPLAAADPDLLEKVAAAAFGQRRKMLRASLKPLGPDPEPRLAAAGIAPTARAEELSVEAFCALARAYAEQGALA